MPAHSSIPSTTALQIYACGDHYHQVGNALPDLKSLTQEATGKAYRRIGRFIQLALIGAARCVHLQAVPNDTAVFFASGRGDLETTLDIMTQLFRDGQTPKPLAFVNTVSNAACFYVAQLLNLQSRSNFVCNRHFAFESALQLAMLDLQTGKINSALVGSVDTATLPLSEHRHRLQLASDASLGEGSHWLWLGPPSVDRPRLGELSAARHFDDRDALLTWMERQLLSSTTCLLSAGQFIDADDFADIQAASKLSDVFDYRKQYGYYDTQSGVVISEFLRAPVTHQHLLHLNADGGERYSAMLIKR